MLRTPDRLHFSTDLYPEHQRYEAWQDEVVSKYVHYETARLPGDKSPFTQAITAFPQLGGMRFACFEGGAGTAVRNQHRLADGNDDFVLRVNRTGSMHMSQDSVLGGRESHRLSFASMGSALITHSRAGEAVFTNPNGGLGQLFIYAIPRALLLSAVPNADALIMNTQRRNPGLLQFLVRYTEDLLLQSPHHANLPLATIGAHLFDMIVMLLGANKDAAHIAKGRGLRAARLQGVLDYINVNFLQPGISAATAAQHVGVSTRYVQMLLEESGCSFSALVNARRLDETRRLLVESGAPKRSISDTAYACGFSDLSYFNRTFKQRFQETPRIVQQQAVLTSAKGPVAALSISTP